MIQFILEHPTNGTAQHFQAETIPTVQMWADMASRTSDPLGGFQAILAFLQQPVFRASVCREQPDADADAIPDECTVVALLVEGPAFPTPVFVGDVQAQTAWGAHPRPSDPKSISVYLGLRIAGELEWYSYLDMYDSRLVIKQISEEPLTITLPAFLTGALHLHSFFPDIPDLYVTPVPGRSAAYRYSSTVVIPVGTAQGSRWSKRLKIQLLVSYEPSRPNPFRIDAEFTGFDFGDPFTRQWVAHSTGLSGLTNAVIPLIANALLAYAQFQLIRDLCKTFQQPLVCLPNSGSWQLFGDPLYTISWTLYFPCYRAYDSPPDLLRHGPVNPESPALQLTVHLPASNTIERFPTSDSFVLHKNSGGYSIYLYFPPFTVVPFPSSGEHLNPSFVQIYQHLQELLAALNAATLQC